MRKIYQTIAINDIVLTGLMITPEINCGVRGIVDLALADRGVSPNHFNAVLAGIAYFQPAQVNVAALQPDVIIRGIKLVQALSGGFSLGGIGVQPAEGMLGDQSGPVRVRTAPAEACSPEPRRDVHAPKPCPNEARQSTERPFLAPALDEPRPTSGPADPL